MKKLLPIIFLLTVFSAKAQFSLRGQVFDDNRKALSFVTIKLKNRDSKVSYTHTDSLGSYFFNSLKPNKYIVGYSAIGFNGEERSIDLKKDSVINVKLRSIENNLSDVQINSKKPLIERKIDRTVLNVTNSISAIGADALELLAKVPGVRVLNDKLSLVGKGGVNVMVNDKLIQLSGDDLSNYLKSISSDNISKIEVITNPPAQYDAQGNNGLINIVLKKPSSEGFLGSISTVFTQANYFTFSTGGNLSYRKNKITLNTNINFRKGSIVPFEESDIFYPNQTWSTLNKDRNFRAVPSEQISLDYQMSKKMILGLSYSTGLTNFHSQENIKTTVLNQSQSIDSILNSDANAKIKSNYKSANFYLKQTLGSAGKQIILNGDWFKYDNDKNRFFNSTSYNQNGVVIPNSFAEYLSRSKQAIDLFTLKADVDLTLKVLKLSFGTKLSFIQNQSDVSFYKAISNVYELDKRQSSVFDYSEQTQAMYFNLNKSVMKWDIQLGLRGEYTQTDGVSSIENNQNNYFQLFPTIFITYRSSDRSVFSASYGRRINRPAYNKLNPFRWYNNQYSYAEGNPFLQPSYNNNIEISHIYVDILTTTFSVNNTLNGYEDVNFTQEGSSIQVSRPINFLTSYNYQLSNSIAFNPLKWLQNNTQFDVYYKISDSNISPTQSNLNGFGAYFSTINQFTFNPSKTFLGDVSFWYQFPNVDAIYRNKSKYNLSLGLKALLLDKKIQLAITANDILKTEKQHFSTIVNHIKQEYKNYYDNKQLRLTLRYNFGNQKIKVLDRKAGNEEERRRNN